LTWLSALIAILTQLTAARQLDIAACPHSVEDITAKAASGLLLPGLFHNQLLRRLEVTIGVLTRP
jgi:hypothetical protein